MTDLRLYAEALLLVSLWTGLLPACCLFYVLRFVARAKPHRVPAPQQCETWQDSELRRAA
jgi:hypothetical protein